MINKKLVGVIGSNFIGTDPFGERSWSGSSKNFFNTCIKYGILNRAFGVELPKYKRIPIILKNFRFAQDLWRQQFRLDTSYYKKLTEEIYRNFLPSDFDSNILQIGGIYNIPAFIKGQCKCFSYHDGNLIQLIKSPFMPKGIPNAKVERAIKYESDVYSKMDIIFTMSNYLRNSFIEDFGVNSNKVKYIGAGINCGVDFIEKEKNYEKKNVLFIGVQFYRKGGEQLLRAFRLLRKHYNDAKLHIVGPKQFKVDKEMTKGVIYHGFLSRENPKQRKMLDYILFESSLFVMPSLYEPLGIAPLEAMVNKIPCILPNKWAFPEMVTSGIHGELVDYGKTDELFEKMRKLLQNPELLKTMGEASRKRVLEHYTWDRVVGRLIKELKEID